jgi:tetraacyldisaccharide 4'-kinase
MLGLCDATLILGADQLALHEKLSGKPCFAASMQVKNTIARALRGQRVLAFCGIGRPEKFGETLVECGTEVAELLAYGDHHAYSEEDAAHILAEAARLGARPVTTEKDAARLGGGEMLEKLRAATLVVPVSITLPDALLAMIYRALTSSPSRTSTASGEE